MRPKGRDSLYTSARPLFTGQERVGKFKVPAAAGPPLGPPAAVAPDAEVRLPEGAAHTAPGSGRGARGSDLHAEGPKAASKPTSSPRWVGGLCLPSAPPGVAESGSCL